MTRKKKKERSTERDAQPLTGKSKRPMQPHLILLIAIILPGVGHVLNNSPKRGFVMLFFTLILAWITYNLTTPQHSFLGRYAGGLFVYAMSILDAYKWARYRYEYHKAYGTMPQGVPQ